MKKYIIQFSKRQADAMGLLTCTCGHPENNHFSFDNKPCAHCDCKKYDEIVVTGILVNTLNDKEETNG